MLHLIRNVCWRQLTVQVWATCMIVSLLTTCMNFHTPPLAQVAPFLMQVQDSRVKRGSNFGHNILCKHVCQLILVCTTQRFQAWSTASWTFPSVEAIATARVQAQHGPDRGSFLSIIFARHWASKSCSPSRALQSVHEISYCVLLLLCSLLSWSVHREKCLKLVHRSLVSLSLCIRLDVLDQCWQLSVSVSVSVSVFTEGRCAHIKATVCSY